MRISSENKHFLHLAMKIAIPVTIQQLINSMLNILDIFMIGKLGIEQITGVGLANQIFFLFTIFVFGINSGASVFMSQYWGKNDVSGIHKTIGISLTLSMLTALVFAFCGFFFPKTILSIYSNDMNVINMGSKYLKIVVFSYIFSSVTTVFNFSLRCIGETRLPMNISIISLFINAGFNALLIFGLFGFPALGVAGAAIATLIARVVELFAIIFFSVKYKFPIITKIKNYFSFDTQRIKNYLKVGGFVIINEVLWAIGTSIYNVAYKFAGTNAQGAMQIATTICDLFFVISIGIGSAAAVSLGIFLGEKNFAKAELYEKKFFKLAAASGIVMSVLLAILIPFILSIFNISEEVYDYSYKILISISLLMTFKFTSHIIIVGVLRCGGDTKYSMLLDFFGVWILGIPAAFLGTAIFHLPIYIVAFFVYFEEFVKTIIGLRRIKTKKWIKNLN